MPDAQWWTSVDYEVWNSEHGEFNDTFGSTSPTGHTLDCAMAGIGRYATVAFLAYGDS
ncbi:hypothetical protein GCM10009727_78870 [Actinomadura napierensis]|uniref:Uncharacterized protein n=1 Tax=Actinomadura napierensis TaxID=267854 RepID=A0ABN3ADX8_9ACTN